MKNDNPSMISFIKDLPNICSLAGLLSALLGIYFAILGNFTWALVGILWAVFFDWADGIVARKMKYRNKHQKTFGPQLDSMIDIVSFGVFPAIFLLSYGNFNPWFLPGAFIILGSSSIRLCYFNIYGMVDGKTYMGLALDNNVIILAFIFLFNGLFSHTVFSIILYVVLMITIILNLAPVKTPKFTGKWFYVLCAYTLLMTIILLFIL